MPESAESGRRLRADAARSRARVLNAAADLIARDGPAVSLEAIARAAGVGSATLHRHFPSRWDLLDAIFKDRARQIADRARKLFEANAEKAFETWFADLVEITRSTSGLAAVIEPAARDHQPSGPSCHATIADAGELLLAKEKAGGSMRTDLHIDELMVLATAISSLPTAVARSRLLDLAARGWSPT